MVSDARRSTQRLTIAMLASSAPMGAEAYQQRILAHGPSALSEVDEREWRIDPLVVRSLRSPLDGDRRMPLSRVRAASDRARRAYGRLLYPRAAVTHRMNLELPPPPHGDVVTLHDVVAWRFPDESPPVPSAVAELRRAAAVICVSEFTAAEAVDLLGIDAPHVIHNGVDARFFGALPLAPERLTALGITRPYLLHAGGASRRKNLDALAAAWPAVHRERPGLQLVLAGPPHPRRTELFAGLPRVTLTGRLPDDDMPGLVAGAAAVAIPSTYEGFGLPALEAMAAGVPVVAAATSALREVVAGAGQLVAPTAAGLADGLLDATSDDAEVARLVEVARARASRFTWDETARGHARVWAAVAG